MGEQELGWRDCKGRGLEAGRVRPARNCKKFTMVGGREVVGAKWGAKSRGQWGRERPSHEGPLNRITEFGLHPEKNTNHWKVLLRGVAKSALEPSLWLKPEELVGAEARLNHWGDDWTWAGQHRWRNTRQLMHYWAHLGFPESFPLAPTAFLSSSRLPVFSFTRFLPATLKMWSTKGDVGFQLNPKDSPE